MPVKKKNTSAKRILKTATKGRKGGMSSTMVVGAAGALVGAALGGAAAAAIAHGRTRKALGETVHSLGEYANKNTLSQVTGAIADVPHKRAKRSPRK